MTNDLVSDMLTRIRNGSLARHSFTRIQYSKLNIALLKVLENDGYIKGFEIVEETSSKKFLKTFSCPSEFVKWPRINPLQLVKNLEFES